MLKRADVSQRQIADDLGIGRLTLRSWLAKRREGEREVPLPDRQEAMAAELRRLRRENEVLRQERKILKKAAAFFAKEGVRPERHWFERTAER